MKNHYLIKIFILLLLIPFSLYGCTVDRPDSGQSTGNDSPQQQTEELGNHENTVTISIEGYETTIIPKTAVPVQEGDTIIDVTVRILQEKRIAYSITGTGPFTYVEGIDDLYEFDHGPTSGWLVKKNGELIGHSAGIEPVEPGDEIEWYYTTEE